MNERILELLLRNLQEVFGEGDAVRRRAAIEELYTDDCVLYTPPGVFVGQDALDRFAGDWSPALGYATRVPAVRSEREMQETSRRCIRMTGEAKCCSSSVVSMW